MVWLFRLLRVEQWYKNVLVFVPLIFSLSLGNIDLVFLSILGFFALCALSSSYYIINDIVDKDKDSFHPEKKDRPIASGKISIHNALMISAALLFASLLGGFLLSPIFALLMTLQFSLSLIYTFHIRKIIFADIILISINFVIRATAGAFIIDRPLSYWVILCAFFISLFLLGLKRKTECSIKQVEKYRSYLSQNDGKIFLSISIMSIACTIIFFSIYSIIYEKPMLLISLPISVYLALSFIMSSESNPLEVRNPEKFIFKPRNLALIVTWIVIVVCAFYTPALLNIR